MSVDLLGGEDVRVAQPLRYVLHGDAVVAEQCSARVPQVVESDPLVELGYGIVKKNVSFVSEALLFWVEAIVYKSVFELLTVFERGFDGKDSSLFLLLAFELVVFADEEQIPLFFRKSGYGFQKSSVHGKRNLFDFSRRL